MSKAIFKPNNMYTAEYKGNPVVLLAAEEDAALVLNVHGQVLRHVNNADLDKIKHLGALRPFVTALHHRLRQDKPKETATMRYRGTNGSGIPTGKFYKRKGDAQRYVANRYGGKVIEYELVERGRT